MKNIVIIGGGTGTFTLLSGLRKLPINNSVIVSTADDGGSTGRLRKDLGVLPPGDIRQCLVGLSYTDQLLQDLFTYRFTEGELAGHNAGNIIIAALEKITGNPEAAIAAAARLLNIRGEVVPVTIYQTKLSAVLKDGREIQGEHMIDEPEEAERAAIVQMNLEPDEPANPRALRLLSNADAVIFGPGDLFTSTIPNLLVKGIKEEIQKSSAKKIFVTNIMTKHGQTDGYRVSDFVRQLEKYLGKETLDAIIVNTEKPNKEWLEKHHQEKSEFVTSNLEEIQSMKIEVISGDLLSENTFQKNSADRLKRSFLRHDPDKLAKIIYEYTQRD